MEPVDNFINTIENIKLEKKPTLKMRHLQDVDTFTKMLLSIYVYNWVDKCPPPRWNTLETTMSDIVTVVTGYITNGKLDTKDYYKLPFKTQQVLFYVSSSSDFGLGESHILSTCGVYSKTEVLSILGASEVCTQEKCPRCGVVSENVCDRCIELLKTTLDYRVESFVVYGVSIKDFKIQIRDWEIEVENSKYSYKRLDSSNEEYQPMLPIVEYQDTTSILM